MIVSHKYKFIFIKTQKTAGTSIETYLSPLCGEKDILTPIFPHVEPHEARNFDNLQLFNHISAKELRSRLPADVWNKYYKFCVERNPWDKTLSHYHMCKFRAGGDLSLDQYLQTSSFPIDYGKYTDNAGTLIVDRVVLYERLDSELSGIFRSLGIPFNGQLSVSAKSEYRTDKTHYRQILSSRQMLLISKAFEKEIALHNYVY